MVTMYGGSDTSYAENGGIALGIVTGNVYQDFAKTLPITTLTLADGSTAATQVTTTRDGHYKFGVTGWNKGVYVDFGIGPFLVLPADMADRIVALESAGPGGGGAVSSVAGRQGAVTLSASDVAGLGSALTAKADLDGGGHIPVAQLPQTYACAVQQIGVAALGTLTPGGIKVSKPTTLSYGVVDTSRAPLGSAITVAFYTKDHATQTYSSSTVATVAAGNKYNFVALTNVLAAQDKWYADVTAVGSTEPGGDILVQVLGTGSTAPPTALSAPNPPTGLTVVNTTSTSNTVSWTAPASGAAVSVYTLYRTPAGGSLTFVANVRAGTTSFLDTGLTSGTAYTYSLYAANDDAMSTAVVSSQFQYMSSATLASDWLIRTGSNSGTAATMTGNTLNVVTGSVGGSGSGDPQDPVFLEWNGGASSEAMRVTFPISFTESTDLINVLLSSNTLPTVATSWTNGVYIQFSPFVYVVQVKAASYNSGATFNITSSATSPAQATTVSGSSNGHVNWISAMSLATKYYVTFELLHVGTGTYGGVAIGATEQVLNIYKAPAAGGSVLQNQIKLNATQQAAIASGKIILQFLGLQATTGTANHYSLATNGSDFTVVPL